MGKFLHAFFSPLGFRRAVPQVWDGFQTNIRLMVIAESLVLVFALGLAIVRGLPGRATLPLRMFAIAYTDFFRGTPLILVAYVWGLGIPAIHAGIISSQSLATYGIISLTLVYLVGGLYTFVVRPRRAMARRPTLTTVSRAV